MRNYHGLSWKPKCNYGNLISQKYWRKWFIKAVQVEWGVEKATSQGIEKPVEVDKGMKYPRNTVLHFLHSLTCPETQYSNSLPCIYFSKSVHQIQEGLERNSGEISPVVQFYTGVNTVNSNKLLIFFKARKELNYFYAFMHLSKQV